MKLSFRFQIQPLCVPAYHHSYQLKVSQKINSNLYDPHHHHLPYHRDHHHLRRMEYAWNAWKTKLNCLRICRARTVHRHHIHYKHKVKTMIMIIKMRSRCRWLGIPCPDFERFLTSFSKDHPKMTL